MQRLFVDEMLASGTVVELPPASAHYLAGVLRLGAGNRVQLFDDRTGEWEATITTVARRSVQLLIGRQTHSRESPPDLWLCAAPLKKGRIDWVAEKATELGVAVLQPVLTQRTVVDTPNLDRLRAHMVEAAEQCGRNALPVLNSPAPLQRMLQDWPAKRSLLFADEEGGAPMPASPEPAAVLIGPEGGFTADERSLIRAHPAAIAISLGPRILRADTAAVAAITLWMARSGDWPR